MANIVTSDLTSTYVVRPSLARWGAINLLMPFNKSITLNYAGGTPNDFDQINVAGISVPNAAPTAAANGAGVITGTRGYYITFYDENTGSEGAPSAIGAGSFTTNTVRITNNATNNTTNSRVTHWRIYRNVGGSVYYRIAEVAIATTTYDDNNDDADIQTNDTLNTNLTAPTARGMAVVSRSYPFLYGAPNRYGGTDYDSNVIWGYVANMDSYPYWNDVNLEPGRGGILRNHVELAYALSFFKDSMIFVWQWDQDPHKIYGDGHIEQVRARRGTLNERTVVEDNAMAFSMDAQGIFHWDGDSSFVELAAPLLNFWERINWAARHTFHAIRDEKRIWFFVALDDEAAPKHAFVYNLQAHRAGGIGQWWVYKYDHTFIDSARLTLNDDSVSDAIGISGQTIPVAMSDAGYLYWLGAGLRDGASMRHGKQHTSGEQTRTAICTVASGTASSITCDGSTYTFADTFNGIARSAVGSYIRFLNVPELPDAYRITGTSDSGGTDNVLAFPTNSFSGYTFTGTEEFVLAPIPELEWQSPLLDFGDASILKDVDEVFLEFDPLSVNSTINARHIRNRLGSPDAAVTVDEVGRQITAGDNYESLKIGGKVSSDGGRGWATHKIKGRQLHHLKLILGDGQHVADLPAVIHSIDFRLA